MPSSPDADQTLGVTLVLLLGSGGEEVVLLDRLLAFKTAKFCVALDLIDVLLVRE